MSSFAARCAWKGVMLVSCQLDEELGQNQSTLEDAVHPVSCCVSVKWTHLRVLTMALAVDENNDRQIKLTLPLICSNYRVSKIYRPQ